MGHFSVEITPLPGQLSVEINIDDFIDRIGHMLDRFPPPADARAVLQVVPKPPSINVLAQGGS